MQQVIELVSFNIEQTLDSVAYSQESYTIAKLKCCLTKPSMYVKAGTNV